MDERLGRVDGGEEAGVADGVDMLGGKGVLLEGVRGGAGVELGTADVNASARVGGYDAPQVVHSGRAAAVIKVQVGEDDVRHVVRPDAEASQRNGGVRQLMKSVIRSDEAFQMFRADACVNQQDAILDTDQTDLHGQHTTVQVIRLVTSSPSRTWHGAEHGTPVGIKKSCVKKLDSHGVG